MQFVWLIPLGFFAGAYGTLIGAGGGFVLVPALLLFYPREAPETITSISLAVVFFNALSGTLAYTRAKRIDYRSAVIFSVATIPGAILGAIGTIRMSRAGFDLLFGSILVLVAIFLAINPGPKSAASIAQIEFQTQGLFELSLSTLIAGAALSTVLGFLSSFLGIGGGFMYVPALIYLLRFPVHIATATSLFILAVTAFTGSATHILAGFFHHGIRRTIALAIGAILGAQFGAKLSQRMQGDWIVRGLAIALGMVGLQLIVSSLWP
ncbi:MAG: sulfite exporter TauE/SafE family protein [Candidatus Binatia bacterium]